MKAIFKYICIVNKKEMVRKIVIQIFLVFLGVMINFAFMKFELKNSDVYEFINIFICCAIFFVAFNVYITVIEHINNTNFDTYIATTNIGIKKMNDTLILFDMVYYICSYIIGNIYIIIINFLNKDMLKGDFYSRIIGIYLWIYVIKAINIYFVMLCKDSRSATILSILFIGAVGKILTYKFALDDIMTDKNMGIIIVLFLVAVYLVSREYITKWWKRGL